MISVKLTLIKGYFEKIRVGWIICKSVTKLLVMVIMFRNQISPLAYLNDFYHGSIKKFLFSPGGQQPIRNTQLLHQEWHNFLDHTLYFWYLDRNKAVKSTLGRVTPHGPPSSVYKSNIEHNFLEFLESKRPNDLERSRSMSQIFITQDAYLVQFWWL